MGIGGVPVGSIGYGKIDQSAIIDYQIIGLVGSLSVVSADMLSALSQATPSNLKVSCTVEIDGVDVSSSCGRCTIGLLGNGGTSSAEIPLLSDSVTINLHQSVVSITVTYTLSNGTTFSQERFRGLAHIIEPQKTANRQSYLLTCFDLGYKLTEVAPIIRGMNSISALDIINAELASNGFAPAYGSFVDYDVSSFDIQYFASSRDLINLLASARRVTSIFWDATGVLKLTDYNDTTVTPFSFPLTAQVSQSPIEDGTDRYNQVPVTGAVSWTYNDTTDQATKGIMAHPGFETPFVTGITDANALGQSIAENSYRKKYSIKSLLNPFVFPGDVVTITLTDNTTKIVRVSEIIDYCGFPDGYWSEWIARATS